MEKVKVCVEKVTDKIEAVDEVTGQRIRSYTDCVAKRDGAPFDD